MAAADGLGWENKKLCRSGADPTMMWPIIRHGCLDKQLPVTVISLTHSLALINVRKFIADHPRSSCKYISWMGWLLVWVETTQQQQQPTASVMIALGLRSWGPTESIFYA